MWITKDVIKNWVTKGIDFGYPLCCIESFCLLSHMNDAEERKLSGTGYVPCKKCSETKQEHELIMAIAVNRNPNLKPFPDEV